MAIGGYCWWCRYVLKYGSSVVSLSWLGPGISSGGISQTATDRRDLFPVRLNRYPPCSDTAKIVAGSRGQMSGIFVG